MKQRENLMEEIVENTLEEIWHNINVCRCNQCREDIIAKSLNDLPPMYFVTEEGKTLKKAEAMKTQIEVDVIAGITKAAMVVQQNPRHRDTNSKS